MIYGNKINVQKCPKVPELNKNVQCVKNKRLLFADNS